MRHRSQPIALVLILSVMLGCNTAEPPMAPNAVPVGDDAIMPMGMVTTGIWRRTRYDVTGSVQLVTENGVARLTISPDFSIGQTPGPVVYLNTTNNPNTGQPLRVGALKARRGAQSYSFQLPSNVPYRFVIIWCDPFNVPMAEAEIPPR
jgi:hypothetical protein